MFPLLRRLLLLLSVTLLSCIAADDPKSSVALDLTAMEPLSTAEVCPGKSLLQASAQRSTWHIADVQNLTLVETNAPDSPKGFRKTLGEFCLVVFCFMLLLCAYWYCCALKRKSGEPMWQPAEELRPETDAAEEALPPGTDAVEDPSSTHPARPMRSQRSSIQSLANKEESDAGDWQIDNALDIGVDPIDYDPEIIPKYLAEHFSSWKLLLQILGALAQFWGALAYMYWSLLYRKEELMDCDAYPSGARHHFFVTHACHYTLACLQGFPVLAANMILVLMVRTLMQTRFYYSMLQSGFLVVFQSVPVMHTMWPWFIGGSMLQGAMHFGMKAFLDPEQYHMLLWIRIVRKFVLPGSIFFSMLFRYADVENTLVPLNLLAELEVTQKQDYSPWLAKMKIMNERVLAFDVRHRDVYSDALTDLGRLPSLDDLIQNVINNYETAQGVWSTRMHRSWGLFRSMWPAALLLDRRLAWSDKDTKSWLQVSAILLFGCIITSLLSVYVLLALDTSQDSWHLFADNIKSIVTGRGMTSSATTLGDFVTVIHAVTVVVLLVNTIHNMFYFSFSQDEVDKAVNSMSGTGIGQAVDKARASVTRLVTSPEPGDSVS